MLDAHAPAHTLVWTDAVYALQDIGVDLDLSLYLVGGVVRDAFLRRPLHDLDLVTAGGGRSAARKIANALKGDYYALDDERDVGRALVTLAGEPLVIDVARFRGADLLADLGDRDFTINAMAVDLQTLDGVIDPLGGETDLFNKRLRRCNPDSIAHDPIRVLRGVRQSAQFGLRLERETLHDIRAHAPHLAETSPERVRDEVVKLMMLPRPSVALRVAESLGVLSAALPIVRELSAAGRWERALTLIEHLTTILAAVSPKRTEDTAARFGLGMMVMAIDRFRGQLQTHVAAGWPNDRSQRALLLLMALIVSADGDTAARVQSAEALAEGLRLSSGERDRMAGAMRAIETALLPATVATRTALHRYWWNAGEAGIDAVILAMARSLTDAGFQVDQDRWLSELARVRVLLQACFEQSETIVKPAPLINGNDLMKRLGLSAGPKLGALLTRIREAQVEGVINSADEAIEWARGQLDEPE